MKTRLAVLTLVALVLGVLLSWKNSEVTPGFYRFGFFLGLASLVAWLLSPSGQMFIPIGANPWKRIAFIPIGFIIAAAPFIVLMEAGWAGYRGFAEFMRYISLALLTIGLLGLVSSFVIPYFLRRHSTR
jgi:hypothetical protein